MAQLVDYTNKRVLVVGGATGMGAAAGRRAAELGAYTIVADIADIDYACGESHTVNLSDRSSVDGLVDAIGEPVDAVLCCAGVADGTPNLMLINFTSQRHLVGSLIEQNKLGRGGAVAWIASVAGLGWMNNLETVRDFLATPDWDTAAAWIDEHEGTDNYSFSKEAINAHVAAQAFEMLKQGMRVNAILPGPTDTPLAQANADLWLTFGQDFREAADVAHLQPEQMGDTMLFLCSDAASGINGVSLLVDQGHVNASLVGAWDDAIVRMLAGVESMDLSGFDQA